MSDIGEIHGWRDSNYYSSRSFRFGPFWVILFCLTGCDLNRLYLNKCITLCHDKAGKVEKFERINDRPPIWDCTCRINTRVEVYTFQDPRPPVSPR